MQKVAKALFNVVKLKMSQRVSTLAVFLIKKGKCSYLPEI